ncbi:glycosyltransferase family 1 protein [Gilvimarinus sp. DA14]|uniref:glycosyltransferase family 4 protein n=1 Tax=Gilvimarinus sp. DA14 TaxID=2956798 RepID=UPI0020B7D4C6|nr:glycosyltransferase family 1 protein [Gilvimarinus sp. DA14]UTF59568.1 glycosyltransferase family 4 protein [Gilvimarinus sp. DA14]
MSNTGSAQRRIFIECSHTYLVGGSSGIRRVARNLANEHQSASSDAVQLVPLVWAGRGFLSPKRPLTEKAHPITIFGRLALGCIGAASRVVRAVLRLPLLRWLGKLVEDSLDKSRGGIDREDIVDGQSAQEAEPAPSNSDGFYRVFGLLVWPLGFLFLKQVRFRRGDIVVLVDSTWDSPAMLHALFEAQERDGIHVGAMLHDLFPLTIPHMCQASTVAGYTGWFKQVSEGVDFFITNSAATSRALDMQLKDSGSERARSLPAGHFRLGAEVHQAVAPLSGSDPLHSVRGFVVLAVGTIEPRKNYQVILDALDELWEKYDVTLVVVGRPGWSSDDVLHRLREHPQAGVRLLHLDNADDAALSACYERADALVCASWAEGFGLPIVEGMRYGAPVLASAIDVFREVGGDACRYFAPDQPAELASELEQLIQQWQLGKPVRQPQCDYAVSWHQSAVQFRDEVLRLACAASSRTASVDSAARSQL